MTDEKQDSRAALRLPRQMRRQIDKVIEQGKFKTLSETVRTALQEYLSDHLTEVENPVKCPCCGHPTEQKHNVAQERRVSDVGV